MEKDKNVNSNENDYLEEFRKSLPIYQYHDEVINLVKQNLFSVITGDTGSGKTTQIPQYIIESLTKNDFENNIVKNINNKSYKEKEIIEELKNNLMPDKDKEKENYRDLNSNDLDNNDKEKDNYNDNEINKLKEKNKNSEKLKIKIDTKNTPKVVVTQPRRVAAIQMAKRVSQEKRCKLGEEIGYSIRFEDYSNNNTIIKYVTDGILVRECLSDPNLTKYNVIILDEAHERSLYTDILFALCKKAVLNRNSDLRLIVTSATLDTKQFSKYFNDCPVFSIHGRCYPVDKIYYTSRMEKRVENSVKIAIRIHLHEGPGHILSFLTGFEECEQACKLCYAKLKELETKDRKIPPLIIMPLYGAQNTDEQSAIFEKTPENCRKLIFSTNIAETSLTVDGIGYVIDCGYVKQKIYNPRTSMDSLTIIPISKVQAVQRAGRAGRTGPGKCIRLYTEQFFENQMPKITIPEILRVNLSSTILTLKSMGIDDVLEFDFMERPEKESIIEALKILYFLQAIDKDGHISKLGQEMSKFPIECCYARVLIASKYFGINEEMCTLISLISCENVWYNVNKYDEERRAFFEKKKLEFLDKYSDHMGLLNIFKEWEFNNFNEFWCRENFLHYRALKQSRNIKEQIKQYLDKVKFSDCEKFFNLKNINYLISEVDKDNEIDDYEKINTLIRMSLCQGFFMNAARKLPISNDETYLKIIDGSVVQLDSNSAILLKEMKPDLVLFTELGGSNTRAIMKQVSIIELRWISDMVNLMKNVDVLKLKGKHKSPQLNIFKSSQINNDIDLRALMNKKICDENDFSINQDNNIDENNIIERNKEQEEKLRNKALDAKERYLQRKLNRNKSG
jgi:ATP-dependent RNA helicase DHX8/PRP22